MKQVINNTTEALEYLEEQYPGRKLAYAGVKRYKNEYNRYNIEQLFIFHCAKNYDLVSNGNKKYVLDCAFNNCYCDSNGIIEKLIKHVFENFSFSEKEKRDYFLSAISDSSPKKTLKDFLYSQINKESIKHCIHESINYGLWISSGKETAMFYFYENGDVNFNGKGGAGDLSTCIDTFTLEFLKKIKFALTDATIKRILDGTSKSFRYKVEYLFTIPEFRKKVINNENWMMYKIGWGKFIDHYPEKEKQKYIKKLLKERKNKTL